MIRINASVYSICSFCSDARSIYSIAELISRPDRPVSVKPYTTIRRICLFDNENSPRRRVSPCGVKDVAKIFSRTPVSIEIQYAELCRLADVAQQNALDSFLWRGGIPDARKDQDAVNDWARAFAMASVAF